MFREPFNFTLQRTPLQAFGWYLVFLLLSFVLGAVLGVILTSSGLVHARTFAESARALAPFGIVVPLIVAIALGWTRSHSAIDLLLAAAGALIGLFFGWLGGGIPLAYLTTRPSRTTAAGSPSAGAVPPGST